MIDPAFIDGLQHAMALPAIMPPAIERAWISPGAERGERIVAPWLTEAEERARAWRTRLLETEPDFDAISTMDWGEQNIEMLDEAITTGIANSDQVELWAEGQRRQALRTNKALARLDPSAAGVQRQHIDRFTTMHRENVAALRRFVTKTRAYRNLVDQRTGAEPRYEPKPWTPNTATANAMREAINGIGMRRVGSVAEMMAELHAEGD